MEASPAPHSRLLMVTGISGAGRSTAMKALEDMGYETVDNVPMALLPTLVGSREAAAPIAVGLDVRNRDFDAAAILAVIDRLVAEKQLEFKLLFLDCDDDRLMQRYTETRHRHPLAGDRPVTDGIALERRLVSPLRARADLVIDTTALNPGDLKRLLHGHFGIGAASGIAIFVNSFSYRHGLPRDADLVLDVRFLRNPYYVPALAPLTGREAEIGEFIAADPDFPSFFEGFCAWLAPLLPRYKAEGKSYLTIAIGCTGGRHRSVYVAELLAKWLGGRGFRVGLNHRDIARQSADFPVRGLV